MHFQWYPGHMTKAKRQMQEDIKLIDLIIELVDARVPLSSRNPDIDELGKNKARMILLNKADLADERQNRAWMEYFKEKGIYAVSIDSRNKGSMKAVSAAITEACKEKTERDRRRGIKNRPVRAMVAGIPNVGKSTFINTFAGKACAKTGNKPGVTKQKQWIRINDKIELLDTPGVLWPKFESQEVALNLAFTGTIKEDILQRTEIAYELIKFLLKNYKKKICQRYGITEEYIDNTLNKEQPENFNIYEIMLEIGRKRGCIISGGNIDEEKTARIILDEFKNGKLGKITLESPKK